MGAGRGGDVVPGHPDPHRHSRFWIARATGGQLSWPLGRNTKRVDCDLPIKPGNPTQDRHGQRGGPAAGQSHAIAGLDGALPDGSRFGCRNRPPCSAPYPPGNRGHGTGVPATGQCLPERPLGVPAGHGSKHAANHVGNHPRAARAVAGNLRPFFQCREEMGSDPSRGLVPHSLLCPRQLERPNRRHPL